MGLSYPIILGVILVPVLVYFAVPIIDNVSDPDLAIFDPRPVKIHTYKDGEVQVEDRSVDGLPPIEMASRVTDLINGEHFNDLLQDCPDEIRPASVIVFYNSSDWQCMQKFEELNLKYLAEEVLPNRAHLLIGRYDMYSAPLRPWYKFTPEMDLTRRFNVKQCPEVVYAPRSCHGFLEWCSRGKRGEIEYMGCKDFKESCLGVTHWDGRGKLTTFIDQHLKKEKTPKLIPEVKTYKSQGEWIANREMTTTITTLHRLYHARNFPAFTKIGFKAIPIPDTLYKNLLDFYMRNNSTRRLEYWDWMSTQMNYIETSTNFVNLDTIRSQRDAWANEYIKPIVEEWSGVAPLKLSAFYGIREYQKGSFLRNHIDRYETHVLSVTLSLLKEPADAPAWPLEVTIWTGDHVRYEHPAGSMVLYESSKLNHGRPYRNQEGIHVGCFCHFAPIDKKGKDSLIWDKLVDQAEAELKENHFRGKWTQAETPEPRNPEYTAKGYMANPERFQEAEETGHAGGFQVQFVNNHDNDLDLVWMDENNQPVVVGTVNPSKSLKITTFAGHRIGWAFPDSQSPIENSVQVMKAEVKIVKFKA